MEELRENCTKERLRELRKTWFEGELTMPKTMFWLIAVICVLTGIIWGIRLAPRSRGATIGSYNGNYNGNGSSSGFWKETPDVGKEKRHGGKEKKAERKDRA